MIWMDQKKKEIWRMEECLCLSDPEEHRGIIVDLTLYLTAELFSDQFRLQHWESSPLPLIPVSHCWMKLSSPLYLPVTWPSQSLSTHKLLLLLLQPLWIIRIQLILSQHELLDVHSLWQRSPLQADERRRNNRGHKSVFSETHFISCQSVMQHIQYKEQQGLQSCSDQKWNSCAA